MPVPPEIAAALLSWAAAFDNREVTRTAAIAWGDALDDVVTLEDGKAAITNHARTSSEYLKPIHINTEVRRIRKQRTDAIGELNPPADLDVADDIAWLRSYVRAIGDGKTPEAATEHACRALGIPVPAQIETHRPLPELGRLVRRVPQEA